MLDIQNILNERLQESQQLEYKDHYFENGKFNSLGQKQKNNLAKEICSFANAEGGTIIIGVSEDEKHNPIKYSDTGVSLEAFEQSYLSDDSGLNEALYPLLTSFANSYGLEKSGMYDTNNKPIEKRFDFMHK